MIKHPNLPSIIERVLRPFYFGHYTPGSVLRLFSNLDLLLAEKFFLGFLRRGRSTVLQNIAVEVKFDSKWIGRSRKKV